MRCQQISLKEGIIIQPLTLLICPVDPCACGVFLLLCQPYQHVSQVRLSWVENELLSNYCKFRILIVLGGDSDKIPRSQCQTH